MSKHYMTRHMSVKLIYSTDNEKDLQCWKSDMTFFLVVVLDICDNFDLKNV